MFLLLLVLFLVFLLVRFIYLLIRLNILHPHPAPRPRSHRVKTLIVLGSGGHTAEMLEIIKQLDIERYAPRHYVIANSDTNSLLRVVDVEVAKQPDKERHTFEIHAIARSREVRQSYPSAVLSTLLATANCVPLLLRTRPELVLTNGPGTCVPVCVVAFLLKLLCINVGCRIVFVESYCRVKTLSLSGRMLLWFTDLFVVQWPELQTVAGGREKIRYYGRLS